MRTIDIPVTPEYDGRKVIHVLRGAGGCSYALIRSLKTYPDGILCNGAHIRTIDRVRAGDVLSITLRDTSQKDLHLCDIDVPILYEDADFIVYNKPAGMACHPVRHLQQGTLLNVYLHHCAQIGEEASTCRIVGRLDRDTSGAVVIAKNAFSAAAANGLVKKRYLALCKTAPNPKSGVIDAPIGRPDPERSARAVMPGGQRAVTEYETLMEGGGWALLRCSLQTGRTHQIRVHLAHIGRPLLGDTLYGGNCETITRQALHCADVSFLHPVEKRMIETKAPLAQDMLAFLLENLRQSGGL